MNMSQLSRVVLSHAVSKLAWLVVVKQIGCLHVSATKYGSHLKLILPHRTLEISCLLLCLTLYLPWERCSLQKHDNFVH